MVTTDCTGVYGDEAVNLARRIDDQKDQFYAGSVQACREYHNHRNELEFRLKAAFDHVAYSVRRVSEVEEEIECWNGFVKVCDSVLAAISSLQNQVPECGSESDFDFILDLRNEAEERNGYFKDLVHGG